MATTSVVCSGLREAVARSSELPGPGGLAYIPFRTLRPAVPSVKVGYGMENIFKVLRGISCTGSRTGRRRTDKRSWGRRGLW